VVYAFTVSEFIDLFKVGRSTAYQEIQSGRLPTYKVGRRRYISVDAAREWQARLQNRVPDGERTARGAGSPE
jgi:excisionase family DNA binding protein